MKRNRLAIAIIQSLWAMGYGYRVEYYFGAGSR